MRIECVTFKSCIISSFFSVYQSKQWDLLKVFNDHTASATGVRFGTNAHYLASASTDRSLKFYQGAATD